MLEIMFKIGRKVLEEVGERTSQNYGGRGALRREVEEVEVAGIQKKRWQRLLKSGDDVGKNLNLTREAEMLIKEEI